MRHITPQIAKKRHERRDSYKTDAKVELLNSSTQNAARRNKGRDGNEAGGTPRASRAKGTA